MMSVKDFTASAKPRQILDDLRERAARSEMENALRWKNTVNNIFSAATSYYACLRIALSAINSESECASLIEGAWQEFRKPALALSPKKEWPSRRMGALDVDWTWIAFDRKNVIRVDKFTGEPVVVKMKDARTSAGLDLRALSRARGIGYKPARSTRRRRNRQGDAGQGAGHLPPNYEV